MSAAPGERIIASQQTHLLVATATGAGKHLIFVMKFIAPGVAAEIIVIIKYQNARIFAGFLLVEHRCSEPTDACADNNKVILFVQIGVSGRLLTTPGKRVGGLE